MLPNYLIRDILVVQHVTAKTAFFPNIMPLLEPSDLVSGIEKESLRITPKGKIAHTSHPIEFGAALTNSIITTDYSEALLELITPPQNSIEQTLNYLMRVHSFAYSHLKDELLWACSMPPRVSSEIDIPIANYGSSNIGQLKHIYRQGLAYRYGRRMQAIAGIHFNFSLAKNFWQKCYQQSNTPEISLQSFIDEKYLGLIRNYFRKTWLLLLLFGASPAVDKSFLEGKPSQLADLDKDSWFGEYATSLRMSNIGYINNKQSQLAISYNSLSEYTRGLRHATTSIEPDYLAIGIQDEQGHYKQLNANALQIEAEYYSPIRPKRKACRDERPITTLENCGIDYIEVRSIDLNPFKSVGLSKNDGYFLQLFLLACLFEDSPALTNAQMKEAATNKLTVSYSGRRPDLKLQRDGSEYPLADWVEEIFQSLYPIAEFLDVQNNTIHYMNALIGKHSVAKNMEFLPSAQFLALMQSNKSSFIETGLLLSQEHKSELVAFTPSTNQYAFLTAMAQKSLLEQHNLEKSDVLSFDAFLKKYLTL